MHDFSTTLTNAIGVVGLYKAQSLLQQKLPSVGEFKRNARVEKEKKKDSIGVFQILLFDEFLPLKCKIIVQNSYVIIAMRSLYCGINVRNYCRLKSVRGRGHN